MNQRRGTGGFWIVFLLFIMMTGSGVFPLLLLAAGVVFFATKVIKSAQESSNQPGTGYQYGRATRTSKNTHTAAEMAVVNAYLSRYFANKRLLEMHDNIDLVLHGATYKDTSNLDVYRNGRRISTMNNFSKTYPDLYESMLDTLITMAKNDNAARGSTVVDAEVVTPETSAPQEEKPQEVKPEEPTTKGAQYYLDTINSLNANIPDEEITNGLYQSSQLLSQIQQYEEKFPDSKTKLDRLYSYYLPILTRILQQYSNLQYAKTDPSYQETVNNLKRVIKLVNDAMQKIISSMTDNDFINLSADLSTLEAVLKKDGLTGSDPLATPVSSSTEGK